MGTLSAGIGGFIGPHRPFTDSRFLGPARNRLLTEEVTMTQDVKPSTEEFKIDGGALLDKIKALIHEGNIRKLTLKNEDGKTLMEIPLTVGLVGVALLPVYAAVGAIAAVATRLTLVVEKSE